MTISFSPGGADGDPWGGQPNPFPGSLSQGGSNPLQLRRQRYNELIDAVLLNTEPEKVTQARDAIFKLASASLPDTTPALDYMIGTLADRLICVPNEVDRDSQKELYLNKGAELLSGLVEHARRADQLTPVKLRKVASVAFFCVQDAIEDLSLPLTEVIARISYYLPLLQSSVGVSTSSSLLNLAPARIGKLLKDVVELCRPKSAVESEFFADDKVIALKHALKLMETFYDVSHRDGLLATFAVVREYCKKSFDEFSADISLANGWSSGNSFIDDDTQDGLYSSAYVDCVYTSDSPEHTESDRIYQELIPLHNYLLRQLLVTENNAEAEQFVNQILTEGVSIPGAEMALTKLIQVDSERALFFMKQIIELLRENPSSRTLIKYAEELSLRAPKEGVANLFYGMNTDDRLYFFEQLEQHYLETGIEGAVSSLFRLRKILSEF